MTDVQPPHADGAPILVAEDDGEFRALLADSLTDWGFRVQEAADGREALARLRTPGGPKLAMLDWQMPHLDGLEVCRTIRAVPDPEPVHIVIATARGGKDNVLAGLRAGANDFLVKPFDLEELAARINVGLTIVRLQAALVRRVRELEGMLARVHQLEGLIPICAWCKKVRAGRDEWQQVEDYFAARSDARFSHGICPGCMERATAEVDGFIAGTA